MVEVKTGDFVLPGDFLATPEEFLPGEGTYEEKGKVYSSSIGIVLLDIRTRKVSVFARTKTLPILKPGDLVIGRVEEVRDQFATVLLMNMIGKEDRELPPPRIGILHISKVQRGFVRDLGAMFKAGDIIKAKVIEVRPECVHLTTIDRALGVIYALCSKCRQPLEKEDNKLKCRTCGSTETRKLSTDYRRGIP
ncbi:MAG: exosome complex RNA-binding protein Csl4 [Candidatus Hadarchaeales archaeon]